MKRGRGCWVVRGLAWTEGKTSTADHLCIFIHTDRLLERHSSFWRQPNPIKPPVIKTLSVALTLNALVVSVNARNARYHFYSFRRFYSSDFFISNDVSWISFILIFSLFYPFCFFPYECYSPWMFTPLFWIVSFFCISSRAIVHEDWKISFASGRLWL